jgi:hypothetical protein
MRLKIFASVAIAVLLCAPAQAASPTNNPKAIVAAMYAQMVKTTTYTLPEGIYTARLAKLFGDDQTDGERGGGVGRLDWDAWVNGQDFQIKNVTVTSRPDEFRADRQIVQVNMINFGKAARVYFYFERANGRWQIDDIRWTGKDGWTLSLVLKYGSDWLPGSKGD